MPQEIDLNNSFDPADDGDIQLIINDDPADDGKVTVDKAEYEAMRNRIHADPNAVSEAVKSLAAELRQQQPANAVQQQVGESDEQFFERMGQELFDPTKTGKILAEAVSRAMAPREAQYAAELADLRRQVAKTDERYAPVMSKYQSEIDQLLSTLTPAQRATNEAMKWATDLVKARHFDEMVEAEIAKRTASAGVGNKAKAPHMERGSGQATGESGGGGRTVKVTQAQEMIWRREAEQHHLDADIYIKHMASKMGGR